MTTAINLTYTSQRIRHGLPLVHSSTNASCFRSLKSNSNNRSELEKRLLAQVCEVREATYMTDKIEVHHIRALKDLNTYEGRDKPRWVKIMAARRRKTLILFQTCHRDLYAGRPLTQKVSRSRTESIPIMLESAMR